MRCPPEGAPQGQARPLALLSESRYLPVWRIKTMASHVTHWLQARNARRRGSTYVDLFAGLSCVAVSRCRHSTSLVRFALALIKGMTILEY